jgi:hypothetical protein
MKAHPATALLMTSLVTVSAQGTFHLDDSVSIHGLTVDAPGNWYSGTFGMEVWERNGTAIAPGINLSPGLGSGVLGYDAMVAAGFVKEATYVSRATVFPGSFNLYTLFMGDVSPPGSTVVVALAAWNTSAPSWSAMLAEANQGTRAGIVALLQPTADPTIGGNIPPVLAMDQDLVMTAIPEPSGLALAGLGGALMLLARRSRRPSQSENRAD